MPSKSTICKTNDDILRERRKCTFNIEELTNYLDKGSEKTKERRNMESYFLSDPELKSSTPMEYMSHKDKYQESIRISCLIVKKIYKWIDESDGGSKAETHLRVLGSAVGTATLKEGFPFLMHYIMFIPTIMGQGTEKQREIWFNRAWKCEILGTYSQTELGHGTFIRGLETTATYDPSTQEFILNSPTLTSYKWWPGGLGQTCNYTIVLAQLYTAGVCHGIHPFIVQIRDEETWMPLPGITIGDIGYKLGMNTVNNGYLSFDKVRIPRDHMLMKNNQVLQDGTYIKSANEKLIYGTMIFVRVLIVRTLLQPNLAKAVTIATRYSAVRRQGEPQPGAAEPQILDYKTQQYKVFPAITTVFALRIAADWLWDIYNNVTNDLDHGKFEKLPELHAMSCCLKAVSAKDANDTIEMCRFACGGVGYMSCSNFHHIYGTVTAAVTYEGENTVLLLQTARHLMKAWQQRRTTNTTDFNSTLKYLQEYDSSSQHLASQWTPTVPCIVKAFQFVAAGKIKNCAENVDRLVKEGKPFDDAWNYNSILLAEAAEAHCRAFIVGSFVREIQCMKVSDSTAKVITQLCELYLVYWLLRKLGDFLLYSNLKADDIEELERWQAKLLAEIRPNAVSLVDSFDIPDETLGSALGDYNGNVYERLIEEANKSPLNQEPVGDYFHKYLKSFLRSNL